MAEAMLSGAPAPSGMTGRLKAVVLGCWMLHAGLGLATDLYREERASEPLYLLDAAVSNAASSGLWVAIFVVAISVTRASREVRGGAASLILLVLLLTVARQWLDDVVWCLSAYAECPGGDIRLSYRLLTGPTTIATVGNMFAVGWAMRTITRSREFGQRRRAARAELLRAQMRALESSLRPHFLFNALQSVTTLMHRDPHSARAMMLGMRRLLEHSVESAEHPEVAVREELEIVELYLGIEGLRFGGRLEVRIDADPAALAGSLPPFVLQPLVENAVHHAIAVRGGGRIGVALARGGGSRLEVTITDTGAGGEARAARSGSGIGLQNVRARLEMLYGRDWRLQVNAASGGTCTTLSIPFRAFAASSSAEPDAGAAWMRSSAARMIPVDPSTTAT
jgi:signal transduction histidine kinase